MRRRSFTATIACLIVFLVPGFSAQASTFTLEKGWNLVSADVVQSLEKNTAILNPLLSDGGSIFGLNPVNKKYYGGGSTMAEINRNLEEMFRDLSDGDDGVHSMGWWVYAPKSTPLNIDFSIHRDNVGDYQQSYHFRRGWNLIGITGIMLEKSFDDIRGSCDIQSFYGYENAEGGWIKATPADMQRKFTESALGRAYAVKMNQDCIFRFSPSLPNVPVIPNN